jgi:hypothetical protein
LKVALYRRAMSAVSSALPESTTTISSAQETESSAAARFRDSSLVMTVTETAGTDGMLSEVLGPWSLVLRP